MADKVFVPGNCPGKMVGLRKRPGTPFYPKNILYLPLDAVFEHEGRRWLDRGALVKCPSPVYLTEETVNQLIEDNNRYERSNGMIAMDIPGKKLFWEVAEAIGFRSIPIFMAELLKDRCPPNSPKKIDPN